MSRILAAVAQIQTRPGDIDGNLRSHLDMIARARSRGVSLLVFPELSLTDYQIRPDVAALARTAWCNETRRIADAAGDMATSFGLIERGDDGAYNTQLIVRDGAIVHRHRKINLPTYGKLEETRHYRPGAALTDVPLMGWRVATLTCADIWNPALPWLAALRGAEMMIAPAASSLDAVDDGFDNPSGWDVVLRHTAMTYAAPIIMANHCGQRGGLRFWGGSRILDASGRILACAGDSEQLITAELDRNDGTRARGRLPTIRDANPELVLAALRDIANEAAT